MLEEVGQYGVFVVGGALYGDLDWGGDALMLFSRLALHVLEYRGNTYNNTNNEYSSNEHALL